MSVQVQNSFWAGVVLVFARSIKPYQNNARLIDNSNTLACLHILSSFYIMISITMIQKSCCCCFVSSILEWSLSLFSAYPTPNIYHLDEQLIVGVIEEHKQHYCLVGRQLQQMPRQTFHLLSSFHFHGSSMTYTPSMRRSPWSIVILLNIFICNNLRMKSRASQLKYFQSEEGKR